MSLDVYLTAMRQTEVFSANYTHNCAPMAREAGIYEVVWRPDEVGVTTAAQLVKPLQDGIAAMRAEPEKYRALNPPNGWGDFESFLRFLESYLAACERNPDATVSTWT